jgi:hypothetical protein
MEKNKAYNIQKKNWQKSQIKIIIFRRKECKLWRIYLVAFSAFHARVGIFYVHAAVVVSMIKLSVK